MPVCYYDVMTCRFQIKQAILCSQHADNTLLDEVANNLTQHKHCTKGQCSSTCDTNVQHNATTPFY